MEEIACRICYFDRNPYNNDKDLVTPCLCRGTLKYVHSSCLRHWQMKGDFFAEKKKCTLCNALYKLPAHCHKHNYWLFLGAAVLLGFVYWIATLLLGSVINTLIIIFRDLANTQDMGNTYYIAVDGDVQYYVVCLMLFLTAAHVAMDLTLFSIFNYVFAYWRMAQFGLIIDKCMFWLFSILYLKQIFWIAYHKLDRLMFILIIRSAVD